MLRPLVSTLSVQHTAKTRIFSSLTNLHEIVLNPTSSPWQQQTRQKHSNRQKKRFFYKNPARHRLATREKLRLEEAGLTPEVPPLPQPRYPRVFEPVHLPNGWSAPPAEDFTRPDYPFKVERTKGKPNNAIGFLPVYSKYNNGGTKATTTIRKISGDRDAFLKELKAVLEIRDHKQTIRVRTGGNVQVDGNHVRAVKDWLAGLGF